MNEANRDIDSLTPETAVKCRTFLAMAHKAGLDVFVTEARRSYQRQEALYSLGRTRAGRIVTNAKAGTGKHEFGLAFDVAFRGANLYPSDKQVWARLGAIGESVGLSWGGRWKLGDSVHFENSRGEKLKTDDLGISADSEVTSTGAAVVEVEKTKTKLPTLKSAAAAAAVTAFLALLPTIATFVPQIAPFVGAINAVAALFGYGAGAGV